MNTCPYVCNNKTTHGYCMSTACINPLYNRILVNSITVNQWLEKADYVQIVRCKNCRNRKTPDCPMYEIIRQEDGWMETVHYRKIDHTTDEDFCSKGVPVHE